MRPLKALQPSSGRGKNKTVGERDRVGGTPSRRRLAIGAVASVLFLLFVLLLALPGNPRHSWPGLKEALQDPRVLIPLSAAVVVGLLACIRISTYRRLLRLPGPIHVLSIDDTSLSEHPEGASAAESNPEPAEGAPMARLDVHFRQRLSDLRLNAPTPTPGTRASADFVELLETSNIDAKQPFAVIGRVLRMVRPSHAYEVKPTLLRRREAPTHGVAMEVVVLPQRRTTLHTYWYDSWEEALDRAATDVTAEVVPRSRHSDSGPWCAWKDFVLDEELFHIHQQAQRLTNERRYEEALDRFYEAVRRDPGNGYLRFALGTLQEELSLYLDALVTYQSIPRMAAENARGHHKRAAERVEFLARYRYTVLLGLGEGLAEQWLPAPAEAFHSRRSDELRELRERLRPDLISAFRGLDVSAVDRRRLRLDGNGQLLERLLDERPHLESHRGFEPPTEKLTMREKDQSRRLRERRMHLFFQLLAEREVAGLLQRYRHKNLEKLDTGLTLTALELLPSWARLHTDRARHLLRIERRREMHRARLKGTASGTARKVRFAHVPDPWPPSPEEIRALWDEGPRLGRTLRARLESSTEFVDHYNVACTYAIAMLPTHGGDKRGDAHRIDALAEAAVEELMRAADVGGSSALAARWQWILTEDPDLAGLRNHPVFHRFETERLPSARPVPVRPSGIVRLNASRSSTKLCRLCTRLAERVWHSRAALQGPTDVHEALDWLAEDEVGWELAREIAFHHRHWQTRLKVIHEMNRFADRNGVARLRMVHPRYADQPIEGDPAAVDKLARHETHFGDLRMTALAKAVGPPGSDRIPGFAAWEDALRALDQAGKALGEAERKSLADNRAAAWGSIRHAFSERGSTEEDPQSRFVQQFAEATGALGELAPPAVKDEPTEEHAKAFRRIRSAVAAKRRAWAADADGGSARRVFERRVRHGLRFRRRAGRV